MAESERPESPESISQPGPDEEHFEKFKIGSSEEDIEKFRKPEWRSELPDIRMEETDEDKRKEEEQAFRAREYLGRDEQYARRDPELQLLMFPEKPQDINKSILRVLEKYTDFDKKEANSPYKIQYYMEAADAGVFIFGHSPEDLEAEGYIEGSIGKNGYLKEGKKPKKFGYAIKVDTEKREPPKEGIKEERERQYEAWVEKTTQTHYIPEFDAEGKIKGLQPVQVDVEIKHPERIEKWKEVSHPTITVERFYYGTENEREALRNASKAGYERLVNTVRMHELFTILRSYRADISGLTTILYLKANHISNDQWSQIFNSPDIAKITDKNLENNEYGSRIDKAMRMMDLLGHAETREKMEDFMNMPTFEKIIETVKTKALELMDKLKYVDEEAGTDEEKAARFLVGKGSVKKDGRWALEGWETDEQRDPAKGGLGFDAVESERKRGVRGFLTEYGNVYARAGDHNNHMSLMHAKIRLLLGDRHAVRDADRITQLTGLRDEWNLEVLSSKSKMPIAEEIIEAHRVKGDRDYNEWRDKADEWLKHFKLQGDPTGSDLSKIFHPEYFRLKDILKDRPAGPLLTTFDYDRFTQSMFSLGRSEVKIEGVDKPQIRSLLEQWRGYAQEGDDMPREEARDLGEIDWNDIHVPEDMGEAVKTLEVELEEELKKMTEEEKDEKIKEKLKEMMEVSAEAVGAGSETDLWSYYTLMNWLAGRDNKINAPWLFILDETENLRVLNLTETYTNKEKFLDIVWHGPAIAWGKWRELYSQHGDTGKVMEHLNDSAHDKVQKGKRDWYKGVRNLYQFPEVMAQKTRYIKAGKTGYDEYDSALIDRVEGTVREPGLVVKMGFMTIDELEENTTKRYEREQELR